MRHPALLSLGFILGLGVLSVPREAHALGPLDLELGAKVGGGTNLLGNGVPNPLGFGVGGRAGVSIFGLYGGVNIVYYLGGKEDLPTDGGIYPISNHSLEYGFEAGYGFKLGPLTLRGQIGVGNFELTENAANAGNVSKGYLYLEPGAVALITIRFVYFGADVNALLLPAGPNASSTTSDHKIDTALTAHGQVGVRF